MAGGLLGYAASMGQGINSLADWLEERARFAGGRVKRLATDPVGLLGTMAGEAGKSFTDFADAAARGDTGATVEGLLNSGLAGPLTFAGVGAKTADKVALQRAKQMANLGEDPVKIWQTTGWTEQFPDRKWRFEIPDNAAAINPKAMRDIELSKSYLNKNPVTDADIRAMQSLKDQWPAAQFMNHGRLFQNYPELMKGNVALDATMKPGQGAFAGESGGGIGIGMAPEPTMRSVGLHELQHAIQQREGFARGGSPEGLPQALQQDVSELRKAARKAFDADKRDVGMALEEKARQLEHMAMWGEGAPYELYKRLAGEAEARLTQSRMNLTPAERMQHPPWLPGPYGFDVPPEQQIVRGLLGEQTGPAMQTVYHGTPHKFDRYDLSKIGTGEGAQAYGHGIYFAENPQVAKTYRFTGNPAYQNQYVGSLVMDAVREAESSGAKGPAIKEKALALLNKQAKDSSPYQRQNFYDAVNNYDALMNSPTGALLRQDLPDEVLPKMLQWDKPLSEQPESVKRALDAIKKKEYISADGRSGAYIWESIRNAIEGGGGKAQSSNAAKLFAEYGIPGLSYLDAGSRKGGKGTMNHVVWDQELLNRMKPEPVGGLLGQQ